MTDYWQTELKIDFQIENGVFNGVKKRSTWKNGAGIEGIRPDLALLQFKVNLYKFCSLDLFHKMQSKTMDFQSFFYKSYFLK